MTRNVLIATAAVTTLLLAAAGVALAHDPGSHVHDASFAATGNAYAGEHISFTVGASNDTVGDYAAIGPWGSAVVLTSITLHDGVNTSRSTHDDAFTLSSDMWTWRAFDEPNAAWALRAKQNTTVSIQLGAHDNASLARNGTVLTIERAGHEATLRVGGEGATISLSGDWVTLTLPRGTVAEFHIDAPFAHGDDDHDGEHEGAHDHRERDADAKHDERERTARAHGTPHADAGEHHDDE